VKCYADCEVEGSLQLLLGVVKGARYRLFTVLGIPPPQDDLMLRVMDLDSNFPLWHGRRLTLESSRSPLLPVQRPKRRPAPGMKPDIVVQSN
jgi:hypothetical protein